MSYVEPTKARRSWATLEMLGKMHLKISIRLETIVENSCSQLMELFRAGDQRLRQRCNTYNWGVLVSRYTYEWITEAYLSRSVFAHKSCEPNRISVSGELEPRYTAITCGSETRKVINNSTLRFFKNE